MTDLNLQPIDYRRTCLSRLVNHWITCDAVLTKYTKQDKFGVEYRMLQNVRLLPKGSVSHLWVELGKRGRNIPYGMRITVKGYVVEYERKDGSKEFGLTQVKVM